MTEKQIEVRWLRQDPLMFGDGFINIEGPIPVNADGRGLRWGVVLSRNGRAWSDAGGKVPDTLLVFLTEDKARRVAEAIASEEQIPTQSATSAENISAATSAELDEKPNDN